MIMEEKIKLRNEHYIDGKTLKYSTIKNLYHSFGCAEFIDFIFLDDQTRYDRRVLDIRELIDDVLKKTETRLGIERLTDDYLKTINIFGKYICKILEEGYDFSIEEENFIFRFPPGYHEARILGQKKYLKLDEFGILMLVDEKPTEKESDEARNFTIYKFFESTLSFVEIQDPEFAAIRNIVAVHDKMASYDNPKSIIDQMIEHIKEYEGKIIVRLE